MDESTSKAYYCAKDFPMKKLCILLLCLVGSACSPVAPSGPPLKARSTATPSASATHAIPAKSTELISMEWLTAMRASEKRWQEDPIVADLLRQYPRKGRPAEFYFPFSSKSINARRCSRVLDGDAGILLNRSGDSLPRLNACLDSCVYQIREDVKVCPEDTPFVSVTDIFSKDFDRTYETQLLNISIGGLLTNVWSDAPCWIGKKESCCIACSRNLQLEEFFHYKCNEVSFFLGSQEYIAEKVLKKVGTGGCCKMEAIQQKFIIWGDLIFAGNSTEIRPYDICLVKKENSMEKK